MLDLGPRSRVAFAALWVGMQVVLVATASRRADGVFAFSGVTQSNVVCVHLDREIDREGAVAVVPIEQGEWVAKDALGSPRRFAWSERVRDPALARVDRSTASTVDGAELARRARLALDDVAAHTFPSGRGDTGDRETRALVLTLTLTVNGHEPSELVMRATP